MEREGEGVVRDSDHGRQENEQVGEIKAKSPKMKIFPQAKYKSRRDWQLLVSVGTDRFVICIYLSSFYMDFLPLQKDHSIDRFVYLGHPFFQLSLLETSLKTSSYDQNIESTNVL